MIGGGLQRGSLVSKITITKRGKGKIKKWKWQLKIPIKGQPKPLYETIEADNKAEANDVGEELRYHKNAEIIKSSEVDSESVDVGYICDFLARDLASDSLSKGTIKRYKGFAQTFFGNFLPAKHPEITKMSEISKLTFGDFKDYLLEIGRKEGWGAEVRVAKPVFSRLSRRGKCPKAVYDALKEYKTPKVRRKEGVILSKTEKKALLDAIKTKRRDYWGITYYIMRTAWRIDEVCNILKENVKTDGLRPKEIISKRADRKIKWDFHFKAFDSDLADFIRQFKYDDRKIYLFANKNNKKHNYRHYEEYLAKVSQEVLKKRLIPTDLRKTCITELVNSGMPPNDLMAITGHRDYATIIALYNSVTEEGIKKGLDATRI